MEIITLNKGDLSDKELYSSRSITVYANFNWNGDFVTSIDLDINTQQGIEERFVMANICKVCDKYDRSDLYILELHFRHSELPHKINGRIPHVPQGQPPGFLNLEISDNTYIIVNHFLYDDEEEVSLCKKGDNHQPERKRGNILVGG